MATYNTTRTTLRCPRCLLEVELEVDLYVGDTSNMVSIELGQVYPFRARRAVQNGGPIEGVAEAVGYAECPACGKDFFCDVVFREGRLAGVHPSARTPPYGPDVESTSPAPCPRCGGHETRHYHYTNMAVGWFLCDAAGCRFQTTTTRDAEAGVYRGEGVEVSGG